MGCPKAQDSTSGKTAALSKETSNKVSETATESGKPTTDDQSPTKVTTSWTKSQATASIVGTMDGPTKATSKTIIETVTVSSTMGSSTQNIEVFGKMASKLRNKSCSVKNRNKSILEACSSTDMIPANLSAKKQAKPKEKADTAPKSQSTDPMPST